MGIVKKEVVKVGQYLQYSQLEIPNYQRPYKWTSENVLQLIDDIIRFNSDTPYRIGTVVIHQEGDKYNIVDGQQRTLTFLLLLKAIATKREAELNTEVLNTIETIENRAFKPTFINDISKKNIKRNFNAIVRRLDDIDEKFINFFLHKCEITLFVIDKVSEAFQFFDSQNARGRDLEPHDLLKAYHLRELANCSSENEAVELVKDWEDMNTDELANLFSDFLYRVRAWSRGNRTGYFNKTHAKLFKGLTLENTQNYPYSDIYRYANSHVDSEVKVVFPFQLDQTVINGKHFFQMVSHYKKLKDSFYANLNDLEPRAKQIIEILDSYSGRGRTGDKYIRMLFDCTLLFYVDKFGDKNQSKAIEKIFIWAYYIRLTYHSVQLVSVDNYVVKGYNLFKMIKNATNAQEINRVDLESVRKDDYSEKANEIKELFETMNYYVS